MQRSGQKARARVSGRPRWTKSEVAVLKRLYKAHSNAAIAKLLGRKVSSVVFKAHRLGLSKGLKRLQEMGRENIFRRWNRPGAKKGAGRRKERKH